MDERRAVPPKRRVLPDGRDRIRDAHGGWWRRGSPKVVFRVRVMHRLRDEVIRDSILEGRWMNCVVCENEVFWGEKEEKMKVFRVMQTLKLLLLITNKKQ